MEKKRRRGGDSETDSEDEREARAAEERQLKLTFIKHRLTEVLLVVTDSMLGNTLPCADFSLAVLHCLARVVLAVRVSGSQ